MARKTSKFRLYPNRQQQQRLTATLDLCRELYNAGLQERIVAWKNRTPVRVFDQINQLPDIKQIRPDVAGVFSQVLQDTLRRLDKIYKAFFGRVQRGQKAGFPRFKGRHRYDSFTYPQSGFALRAKLQLSKIASIKIKQHRDIAGEIKTLTIRREAGCWYACFSVAYQATKLPHNSNNIGVDLGLEAFATLSNGTRIENHRYYQAAQAKLRRAQRKVARRANKKSKRRRKAIAESAPTRCQSAQRLSAQASVLAGATLRHDCRRRPEHQSSVGGNPRQSGSRCGMVCLPQYVCIQS
jgi:putative transposase